MKQEYQKRFLLYCQRVKNEKPEKVDLTDYIIFISKMSREYKEQNKMDVIIDQDNFTDFIEKNIGLYLERK